MNCTQMINNQGRAVANQFIINDGNIITFQSYNSKICDYDNSSKKLKLYVNWDYSRTTLKYFKQFLEDFTIIEYNTKAKFDKKLKSLVNDGIIELMY